MRGCKQGLVLLGVVLAGTACKSVRDAYTQPTHVETMKRVAEEAQLKEQEQKAVASQMSALSAEAQKEALDEVEGRRDFMGIGFGIAPSLIAGGDSEVESAEVVDAGGVPTVRVTSEHRAAPALLLETHYFFVPKNDNGSTQIGHGPFLALEVGDNDVVGGLGFGYMVGWRAERGKSTRSFNVGVGPFLDRDVQQLAKGFRDGQATPNGEDQVSFRTEDEWRWMLTFSFSWGI